MIIKWEIIERLTKKGADIKIQKETRECNRWHDEVEVCLS